MKERVMKLHVLYEVFQNYDEILTNSGWVLIAWEAFHVHSHISIRLR